MFHCYANRKLIFTFRRLISCFTPAFNHRFYLAVATSKADKCEAHEAIYRQFLIDGLNLFLHNHLHNSKTVNIVENFSSIYNIQFYEGISELANFLKGLSQPSIYDEENLLQFISMLSFYGMSCTKVRRDVYLQLQSVYLQARFSFGQLFMKSRNCKALIKKYWDNLLGITIAFCQANAVEVLDIQKKVIISWRTLIVIAKGFEMKKNWNIKRLLEICRS